MGPRKKKCIRVRHYLLLALYYDVVEVSRVGQVVLHLVWRHPAMNPGINHGNASHNVAISCDRKVQRMPFL